MGTHRIIALWCVPILVSLIPSVSAQSLVENPPTTPPPHEQQDPAVEKNLKVFYTLDFDVFIHNLLVLPSKSSAPRKSIFCCNYSSKPCIDTPLTRR